MPGWHWNVFDAAMVVFQVTEEVIGFVGYFLNQVIKKTSSEASVLRMMRIFRLFRVLRLVRLMSVFSELRMFVVSVIDSMKSLFWTILLLLLVMYIAGVCLTQLVTNTKMQHRGQLKDMEGLHKMYGTLDRSMLTLYQTISEGIHWHVAMKPLVVSCSPWMSLMFCLWIAFCVFALLNVVTGVFVESALRTANEDQKKLLMYQMGQWFSDADADQTGTITWDEFRYHLEDPKMEKFLKIVDLDAQEAWDLFHLLDVSGVGEIPVDDFVNGCVRVTGNAKAIDLVTFMHTYKVTQVKLAEHAGLVEDTLLTMERHLKQILTILKKDDNCALVSNNSAASLS